MVKRTDLPRKLNLGCGRDLREGYLNVDGSREVGADLVFDLDVTPYDLPAGWFDEILALDVVEHLGSLVQFVEECHRLLRPGGELRVTTPHFSSANSYVDPTHRRHLSVRSFDYFSDEHGLKHYSRCRFDIVDKRIVFAPTRLNRFVAALARRYPARYEERWSWMFPAWFLEFRLRAVATAADTSGLR